MTNIFEGPASIYPASEILSPPDGGHRYTNPDPQENVDPCFDSAIFEGADSPFRFLSPINAATGELARGPDELMPHLGSYAKAAPENKNFNPLAMESFRASVFLERY